MVERLFGPKSKKCPLLASQCYFVEKLKFVVGHVTRTTYDKNYSLVSRYRVVTVRWMVL